MINVLQSNHPDGLSKRPADSDGPDTHKVPPGDPGDEVDDKILHQDDDDLETGDKIDDAELDPVDAEKPGNDLQVD